MKDGFPAALSSSVPRMKKGHLRSTSRQTEPHELICTGGGRGGGDGGDDGDDGDDGNDGGSGGAAVDVADVVVCSRLGVR